MAESIAKQAGREGRERAGGVLDGIEGHRGRGGILDCREPAQQHRRRQDEQRVREIGDAENEDRAQERGGTRTGSILTDAPSRKPGLGVKRCSRMSSAKANAAPRPGISVTRKTTR